MYTKYNQQIVEDTNNNRNEEWFTQTSTILSGMGTN